MKNEILWYKKPAQEYVYGMPLGNGHIGTVVLGGTNSERINLNDDTLWSGYPRVTEMEYYYDRFVRRMRKNIICEKDFYTAEDLADKLQGPYSESYISAGELLLEFPHEKNVNNYKRGLDMRRGVAFVEYEVNGVNYKREHFCSAVDNVIALRISSDTVGALSLNIDLDSLIRHEKQIDGNKIILTGRAPRHVEPQYLENDYGDPQAIVYDELWEDTKGLRFCNMIQVLQNSGKLYEKDGKLCLSDADECVILVWLGTDFKPECRNLDTIRNDYRNKTLDLIALGKENLGKCCEKGYKALLNAHEEDMRDYFDRVSLEFDYDKELDNMPTDERKARYDSGESDAGFEKQAFDFGRYLLYSCSREGTEAANLQGIWCWELRPRWSCNYTVNINTQMNYWGADLLNMPECHLPLFTFLEELTKTGAGTARTLYNARGFCLHHNTDLWRCSLPIGMGKTNSKWSLFPTAGIWLSLHIMEHYRFTGDKEFLKRYFHILKKACQFAIDMMCEMDDGYLGICPATVPERRFFAGDDQFTVGVGSTFDYELVYDLFDDTRKAIKELSLNEDDLLEEIKNVEKRFPPIPTRADGIISDWQWENRPEPYLWVNVLFGLYPGRSLLERDLISMDIIRHTMETQDIPTNTFSNMWSAGAWARLKDSKMAYSRVRNHIKNAMVNSLMGINLNGGGEFFQTDANLGLIAAFAEMLLQSDEKSITLLPAVPDEWKNGEIKNFRTRCGVAVSMRFTDGIVTELSLTADRTTKLTLYACCQEFAVQLGKNETKEIIKDGIVL